MFKINTIKLKYLNNHIIVNIFRYTGIRYDNIIFPIKYENGKYVYEKKYQPYMNEYKIMNMIKNKICEKAEFNEWNKNQKSLNDFRGN